MIKTFLRLRPVSLLESQRSQFAVNGNSIEITLSNNKYSHEYDHIIDSSMTQEKIFELVVLSLTDSINMRSLTHFSLVTRESH